MLLTVWEIELSAFCFCRDAESEGDRLKVVSAFVAFGVVVVVKRVVCFVVALLWVGVGGVCLFKFEGVIDEVKSDFVVADSGVSLTKLVVGA